MREGLTFDDVLLQPKYSTINSRKEVNTRTRLTKNITLNVPVISANMDTVTESPMAICMAELGGIGIIHRFLTLEQQVREVVKVKRAHNFIIHEPYSIDHNASLGEVKEMMRSRGVHSLLVINGDKHLQGIVTTRDLLFEDDESLGITSVMTPLEKLICKKVNDFSDVNFEEARIILKKHKLEKLPLIDENGVVKGLITVKDIEKRLEFPNAVKDEKGRLRVGAAIGVKNDYFERTQELVKVGVDVLVIDIAHGHAQNLLDTLYRVKSEFPHVDIIAGNVATKHGTADLINAGADAIKVGIGGGCFGAKTRVLMANGTYKNIEDVKIGDRVINKDGKAVNVTNSFSTGVKKVLKVRNSVFYEDTFVTPDHQHWVSETKEGTLPDSKYNWKPISEVKAQLLLLPKNIGFELADTFSIELKTKNAGDNTEFTDITLQPNYNLGYILGIFLGDGIISYISSKNENNDPNVGKVTWHFGQTENKTVEKLQMAIHETFKKEVVSETKRSTVDVTFVYKPFVDFLSTFDKRENRHLPSNLLVNNKEYLQGLFDGMVDSDGYIKYKGRVNLVNNSKQIIELFNIVSFLLNGVFPDNSKPPLKESTIASIKPSQSYQASFNSSDNTKIVDDYHIVKLLEASETELEIPVYDITVDCETHSFIANNAVVHNSTCVTRMVTGSGVPQLTAVLDCCDAAVYEDVPVISDGGIRYSGDIVKALAAGANSVMLGGLFAGCEESPGLTRIKDGQKFKIYRGMASFDAAANRVNAEKGYEVNLEDYVPEGIETVIPYKGRVKEVMEQLIGGLRSGMSYLGVNNIEDMSKNADFIKMSSAGWLESKPHAQK